MVPFVPPDTAEIATLPPAPGDPFVNVTLPVFRTASNP
jgi:hypothetical protein